MLLEDLVMSVKFKPGYVELHEFCAALGFDPRASPASQETARLGSWNLRVPRFSGP